jgi:6-phosphogluconolactonase
MAAIRIADDEDGLARAAAEEFCLRAEEAAGRRGVFRVALAGGSTPRRLHRLLAGEGDGAFRDRVPWERTWFFFGDERHVPPTHPDSNYRAAYEDLLGRAPVPPGRVVRIWAESPDAGAAASYYEHQLREAFGASAGQVPRFDLVILGLGADAHTASLFPGSPALRERSRLAAAPWVETLGRHRITVTPPVLNAAACVFFLVAGGAKAEALRSVLEDPRDPDRLPAQVVAPDGGDLIWLADRAAASLLGGSGGSHAHPL